MLSIVQHSRPRKDNESSETKIYPERNKKSRIQTYETLKHFENKMVKKILRPHL